MFQLIQLILEIVRIHIRIGRLLDIDSINSLAKVLKLLGKVGLEILDSLSQRHNVDVEFVHL
jgi:hypothetical protein